MRRGVTRLKSNFLDRTALEARDYKEKHATNQTIFNKTIVLSVKIGIYGLRGG